MTSQTQTINSFISTDTLVDSKLLMLKSHVTVITVSGAHQSWQYGHTPGLRSGCGPSSDLDTGRDSVQDEDVHMQL